MEINNLEWTCSMAELGDVPMISTHIEYSILNSKDKFKLFVNSSCCSDIKALIHNTNATVKSKRYKNLLNLGFKPTFSYLGNNTYNGRRLQTHVMMLDLRKEGYL